MAIRLLEKTQQEKKQELRRAWRFLRKSGYKPEEIFRSFSLDKKMPPRISFEGNRSLGRMEIVLSEGKFGEQLVLEGKLYHITKCFYGMELIREIPATDAREIAFQLPTASDMPMVKSSAGEIAGAIKAIPTRKLSAISDRVDFELGGECKSTQAPAEPEGKSMNVLARFKERMSDFFSKKKGAEP